MDITEDTYPVFEVNQVLTNAHLNNLFSYLDEQTRLTRANLIGIGIVCGLEVQFNGTDTIHLTKGCGITSEGYLILEPTGVDLVAVRPYPLPTDDAYPPLVDKTKQPPLQYQLWELLDDDDETGAVALTDPLLNLAQKAVLLFLELRRDAQPTCSPASCDDRGAQVTATLRRLLVDVSDLDRIIAATPSSTDYLGADLTERLALPDLRMPRFDVANTVPVATAQVLQGFQEAFRANRLAAATAAALTALYTAFKPVVVDLFAANPFSSFLNRFGFLDSGPVTTEQVRFLPYYWDLFDDLLAAYDELRWTGVDLLCACCPPSGLFPRHLMAGVLDPTAFDGADYRHQFVRSPAVGDCADRTRQLRQLFRRLVAMLAAFSEEHPDRGIKATPSRWGEAPLSVKAIPCYYRQDLDPPLYTLWDPVRTARGRANQNLGYRSGDYVPSPPPFVTDPLRFDLEPNNFLRIEGHLGRDVQSVLKVLLGLRGSHRLPIEVVALRTGAFEEDDDVNPRVDDCRFTDLETLYDTLKAELNCFLVTQVKYFYALPLPAVAGVPAGIVVDEVVPTLSLLRRRDPQFRAQPDTLGAAIESALTWRPGRDVPWSIAVVGGPGIPGLVYALVGALSAIDGLLADDLRRLDVDALADQYHRLVGTAAQIEAIRRSGGFDAPGLSERLDDIVFRCRLDPFTELVAELRRRIRDAKQAEFLGHFLANHPGVQHKAGVPLGGTFVLVYHRPARPVVTNRGDRSVTDRGDTVPAGALSPVLARALARLPFKAQLAGDPDVGILFQELTGRVLSPRAEFTNAARGVYAEAVAGLEDGTVVADFFLPYMCGPGCATVQFQLPPTKLRVTATTGCTNIDGFAVVTITAEGATPPLSVKVDDDPFVELAGPLLLGSGDHTVVVRDSDGAGSTPVQVHVPPTLRIRDPFAQVDQAAGSWLLTFTVDGGTPPYAADTGSMADARFTGPSLRLDESLTVQVKDAAGCVVAGTFESGVKACELPCDGAAARQGFRFWLPEARPNLPINGLTVEVTRFQVVDAAGNRFDLTADVAQVLRRAPDPIRTADFAATVERWLTEIDALVAQAVGSTDWLTTAYESPTDKGPSGTLFVDRLQCIEFAIQLDVSYVQGRQKRRLQVGYSPRGTVVVDPDTDAKARIPVFGVTTSNKCRPQEPPVPACEGTDLQLELKHDGAIPDPVVFSAGTAGNDQVATFFWEFQDGVPSVANGDTVTTVFRPPEPVEKLVRVTAYTEKGCSVTLERLVDVSRPGG